MNYIEPIMENSFSLTSSDPSRDDTVAVPLGTVLSYTLTITIGTTGTDYTNLLVEITTNVNPTFGACAGLYNVVASNLSPGVTGVGGSDYITTEYIDEISDHVVSS